MKRIEIGISFALILLAVGCGKKSDAPDLKKTVKVSGTVTVNGEAPPWKIQLEARPEGGLDAKNPTVSFAEANEDGTFEFSTYTAGDGVPEGSYSLLAKSQTIVSAFANGVEPPDKLGGKYATPEKSPKKFQVPAEGEPIDLGTIDLKANIKKKK